MCEISGAGQGAFKEWRRIYHCDTKEEAIQEANKELDEIKTNRNILITGFYCLEVKHKGEINI